jgi:hypothetical protein
MRIFIAEMLEKFRTRDVSKLFKKCGYLGSGLFDHGIAFQQNIKDIGF